MSRRGPVGLVAGIGAVIGVVAILAAILVPMFSARPLVNYTISETNSFEVPRQLDFRNGAQELRFRVRNRGASDAPTLANITVVNAYVGANPEGPFNKTSIVFPTSLDAHTEYDGWSYFVMPANNAPIIQIHFSVTKRLTLDGSGIVNWLFGEYNGYSFSLTYVQQSPGLYVLKD